MKMLKIITAYIHDFASALWVAALLAIYWTDRTIAPHGLEEFFFQFKKEFFYFGIVCLVIVMVTGAGRTLTYTEGQFGHDSEEKKKRILIIKHIIGFVIYGLGTYWQYLMVFN